MVRIDNREGMRRLIGLWHAGGQTSSENGGSHPGPRATPHPLLRLLKRRSSATWARGRAPGCRAAGRPPGSQEAATDPRPAPRGYRLTSR